ncbi:MAG: NAD-dependent epimerase/dehydratase family protein, partial [Actinomycetia bacterium]|nr:NAD-dependent epimerase/dehydratase family protein [Actinomycetes bacterium]
SAMPTNLYGPGDNFDAEGGHVLPMLMRRFHEAKVAGDRNVSVWGSGNPMRELMHVDDLADACIFLMDNYDGAQHVNVGTGIDVTIRELAETVRDVVYPDAELVWDASKPDGSPRKLLDVSKIHTLGWRHKVELREGIESTYGWFLEQDLAALRGLSA